MGAGFIMWYQLLPFKEPTDAVESLYLTSEQISDVIKSVILDQKRFDHKIIDRIF